MSLRVQSGVKHIGPKMRLGERAQSFDYVKAVGIPDVDFGFCVLQ